MRLNRGVGRLHRGTGRFDGFATYTSKWKSGSSGDPGAISFLIEAPMLATTHPGGTTYD
jgi:hypothetical protein